MRVAMCAGCGQVRAVNVVTRRNRVVGEYCGDCFDLVDHDDPPRNRTCKSSGLNHNDPGLDNAIRALEEDR